MLRGPCFTHAGQPNAHTGSMGFLYFLADTFIDTFGITRPTEKTRKQAAFFILALLVLMLVGVATAGYVILMATR